MKKLIYLEDAIDALEQVARLYPYKVSGERDTYGTYNEAWNDAIGRAEIELEQLPSAQSEPQWIPVTERLPEPFEYCLWTTTDGRVVYHHCDGLSSNYTAWMPLPEPYEGDKK